MEGHFVFFKCVFIDFKGQPLRGVNRKGRLVCSGVLEGGRVRGRWGSGVKRGGKRGRVYEMGRNNKGNGRNREHDLEDERMYGRCEGRG